MAQSSSEEQKQALEEGPEWATRWKAPRSARAPAGPRLGPAFPTEPGERQAASRQRPRRRAQSLRRPRPVLGSPHPDPDDQTEMQLLRPQGAAPASPHCRGCLSQRISPVLSAKTRVPILAKEMHQHFSLCESQNDSGQKEEKSRLVQDKDLEPMQGSYDPQSNHDLTTLHA